MLRSCLFDDEVYLEQLKVGFCFLIQPGSLDLFIEGIDAINIQSHYWMYGIDWCDFVMFVFLFLVFINCILASFIYSLSWLDLYHLVTSEESVLT